jgi:hypothetical protein
MWPQSLRDRQRGRRVVSGDHDDADPGLLAPTDRLDRLVAGRVDHPLEADEAELAEVVLRVLELALTAGSSRYAIARTRSPSRAIVSARSKSASRSRGSPA